MDVRQNSSHISIATASRRRLEVERTPASLNPAPFKAQATSQAKEVGKFVVNGEAVELVFNQDKITGQSMIEIYHQESGRLIRKIPVGEILAFLAPTAATKGGLVSRHL